MSSDMARGAIRSARDLLQHALARIEWKAGGALPGGDVREYYIRQMERLSKAIDQLDVWMEEEEASGFIRDEQHTKRRSETG